MRKENKFFRISYKMEGQLTQEIYDTRYDAERALRFASYYEDVELLGIEESHQMWEVRYLENDGKNVTEHIESYDNEWDAQRAIRFYEKCSEYCNIYLHIYQEM